MKKWINVAGAIQRAKSLLRGKSRSAPSEKRDPEMPVRFRSGKETLLPLLLAGLALGVAAGSASAKVFLDPVFNQGSGTDNYAEQVLPLADGKVLVCGDFWNYNGEPAEYLIRLNEDGTLDHSFHSAVNY